MKRILLALATTALLANCAGSRVMFDDFTYSTHQQMEANGWIVRTAPGWPGVPGATWSKEGVTLLPGGYVLMTSSTDSTPANTRQNQICHERKYREGTYAARVRFTDAPVSGPNGDQIVETFYMIAPQKAPMHPDYSEADFEYLPNGGWGQPGATMWATTWETFQLEPWIADNENGRLSGSFAGWKTLVAQIGNGRVRYFVDGAPLADHGDRVYPEEHMSINFNLWFVRDGLAKSTEMRRWEEDIDWVFFSSDQLTHAQVVDEVERLRARGTAFRDNVRDLGLDSPCNF